MADLDATFMLEILDVTLRQRWADGEPNSGSCSVFAIGVPSSPCLIMNAHLASEKSPVFMRFRFVGQTISRTVRLPSSLSQPGKRRGKLLLLTVQFAAIRSTSRAAPRPLRMAGRFRPECGRSGAPEQEHTKQPKRTLNAFA